VQQVFSSGIRIGFVTGPPPLVNRINLHSQSSNLHVSGVSQVLVQALFRHWGVGDSDVNETAALGHLKGHVDFVVSFYRTQCDAFVAAADKHLKGLFVVCCWAHTGC
jgi:kynurenine/2-aminoadipate aminotransferase